ncbi:MAG TPA: hypothetical protein VHB98_07565 [Chloroflexota bacterium]|nr:hypothetical protein [Chloroflexota bacterium]
MVLVSRVLALTGSLTLALSGLAASATAATTTTFPLHGTKMASMAHGIAAVTQTSPGDYKVVITLSDMPVPSTLHTTPIRHAYVAWAFNASMLGRSGGSTAHPQKGSAPRNPLAAMGMLIAIPLHATNASTYTGSGVVMMKQVPGILVTAEVSAMVHKPALPLWGVLFGSMTPQQR